MRLTAESTTKIVELAAPAGDRIPARIWEAVTEAGVRCHLYVTRIGVDPGQDVAQFEAELQQERAPSPEIAEIPLRLVL